MCEDLKQEGGVLQQVEEGKEKHMKNKMEVIEEEEEGIKVKV